MKLLKYINDNFGVEMTEDGPTSGFLNSNKRKYDKLLNTDTQFSELVDKFVQLKQEVANVVPKPKDDSKTTFVTQPLPGGARKEDGGTIRFDR
jgi:hypothetical protein